MANDGNTRGRIVYSRGPIIRTLEFISAFAGIGAIVALVFVAVLFSRFITAVQESRAKSAADTCFIFRTVVLAASDQQGKHAQGEAFLDRLGLNNCDRYGRAHVRIRK